MQLNTRLLECFHATMTVGTVTRAAEVLHTSQPAVSRSLKQLEHVVEMELFKRSGNSIVPTKEAFLLFEEVDKSFRGIKRISRAAKEIKNLQQGKIHIACAPAYSQGFLVSAMKTFSELRPRIQMMVSTRQTPTISELVASQQCDIGLTAYAIEPTGSDFQPFTDAPEICLLPSGHRLCSKKEITPEDLHSQNFISLGQNDPYSKRLHRVLEDRDITLTTVMEVHNSIMAAEAVAQGLGVTIINPFSALSYRHRGVVFRRFSVKLPFGSTLIRSKFQSPSVLISAFEESLLVTRDNYLKDMERLLDT